MEKSWQAIDVTSPPHLLMTELYWAKIIRAQQAKIHGNGLMGWREWIIESAKYSAGMISRHLGIKGRAE